MIKLFRNIRKNLLNEGKTSKYFKYAIGEIILVVIGILIALQINNWNENRKEKAQLNTNIKSIAKEIQLDILLINKVISVLHSQVEGGQMLIPIMESEQQFISDSLTFILNFNAMTSAPIITKQNNTWDFLNSSGVISEFSDEKLLEMLQSYYSSFNAIVTNFNNSAIPGRLEIRKLKYELFSDTEHRKFFPTNTPIAPNKIVYNAIFEDKRVLPLCRFIGSTANYFEDRFESLQTKATAILVYIDTNYN
jgi:hypothetical protein